MGFYCSRCSVFHPKSWLSRPETILLQVNREQQESHVVVNQGIPENLCFGFASYSITAHVPESLPWSPPSASKSNWRGFCCFNSSLLLMGGRTGVGGGSGEKSTQVVLYEFGVVFSLFSFFNNFIFGECHFFLFPENTEVHTLLVLQNTQGHKSSPEYRIHLLNLWQWLARKNIHHQSTSVLLFLQIFISTLQVKSIVQWRTLIYCSWGLFF